MRKEGSSFRGIRFGARFISSQLRRIFTAIILHSLFSHKLFSGRASRHLAVFLPMPCIYLSAYPAPFRLKYREKVNPLQSDGHIKRGIFE